MSDEPADRNMTSRRTDNSQRVLTLVRMVYHKVNLWLWPIGATGYCAIFVLPKVPSARVRAEMLRAQQIDLENEWKRTSRDARV